MQLPTIPKIGPLSKKRKITVAGAGAAAAAAVVLTVTGLQATGGSAVAVGDPTGVSATAKQQVKSPDTKTDTASQRALADHAAAQKKAAGGTAAKKAPVPAAAPAKKAAPAAPAKPAPKPAPKPATSTHRVVIKPAPAAKAPAPLKAAVKPAPKAAVKPAVKPVKPVVKAAVKAPVKPVVKPVVKPAAPAPAPARAIDAAPAAVTYPNNLDGWIRQSLAIMHEKGIPGSYNGIYRNIIRESSGNPNAINLWDINAQNGIPSKGLLQVIPPTFQTYHVNGTSWNIYDPVANITAACNYAAARYGSMDNVYSAY